jgi:tetratricopeptide (TPR) repeat protein/CHAT domain-containing protein
MDEQRIEDYINLIEELLSCPSGKEMEILHTNSHLIDDGLVKGMNWVSEEGGPNAEWLKALATLLAGEIAQWSQLNQQIIQLYKDEKYEQAVTIAKKSLDLAEKIWGSNHPNIVTSLDELAGLYYFQGCYAKAEALYIKSLAITKRLRGNNHSDVVARMNNLAGIYYLQGRYTDAEQNYVQVLQITKHLLEDENPDIATSLNNLAVIYYAQARYDEAEPLYLKALEIRKRCLGDEDSSVANSLNSLAQLYKSQGRYPEAEHLYLKSLKMLTNRLGYEHLDVATNLNNLAGLYYSQGCYDEAKHLYVASLAITKRLRGNNHPDVATSLINLAALYRAQRLYDEAEVIYTEVLEIWMYIQGNEHPNIATTLNNIAYLYSSQGYYKEAKTLYLKALEMRKRLLGKEHPEVADCLLNLAGLFAATNRPSKALSHHIQAIKIDDKMIPRIFSFSSETDRLAYLQKIRANLDGFLSLVYNYLCDSPQALQVAFDLVLKRKALTASALAAQNEALYSDRYPHLTEDFRKLRDLSEQIIYLTFSTPKTEDITTYQQQLVQLEAEHNNLQKQLASQVPEIQLQEQTTNRGDVASRLPVGSLLIEFVRFNVFNFQAIPARGEAQVQPARYLAFILPAGQPESVEMIDIGEAEYIDSLIREFRELVSGAGKNPENQLGMVNKRIIIKEYQPQAGIKLREAVFDKLRPYLKESQHLIIAPDGELNLVPFQILKSDDTGEKMLMDEFTISYLTVGRDILRQKIATKRPASLNALVFASPNFDLSAESVTPDAPTQQQNTQPANLREFIANNPLKFATGTNILGERVAQRLNVAPYLENEALESYFNPLQCPRILLVATHGVFLPNQPEDRPRTSPYQGESGLLQRERLNSRVENPMLRSALALAGANTWAKGGKLPPEAGKGILFAQDVAGLDLWANEISVLSACETGIGDVAIGEGVFGLRRAFAVAGAKTLIMSLWSVNGWTTTLLMERFFDNCEAGNGRAAALQEAQNYVQNITVGELQQFELGRDILKYEFNNGKELDPAILARQAEDRPLAHPYYWGAWICQGDTCKSSN